VALEIYALDSRKVAAIEAGIQRSGPQTVRWDGRDQHQNRLAPGIYLLSVAIASETAAAKKILPVGLVY